MLQNISNCETTIIRTRIHITGAVQGVGFRPFVFNLAQSMQLSGWVRNDIRGLDIEIEGTEDQLQNFIQHIKSEHPAVAEINDIQATKQTVKNESAFRIIQSDDPANIKPKPSVLPDIASCPACLQESQDPNNRRYRYPFTSCTQCGPRWSIIESLPYDRPNTAMGVFSLCVDCEKEYNDPADRRFYHQANCCPACGPQLALLDNYSKTLACKDKALTDTVAALRQGKIIALKGIGGFQLLADAKNEEAIAELRQRKQRPAKPFALMCASLEQAQALCSVSQQEAETLQSAAAPIVLLKRVLSENSIAPSVAPHNPYLGIMLPYSILHDQLLEQFASPLVCTSGNLSGEPICRDEQDAVQRLAHIADLFLVHNRRVARTLDDSVAQIVLDKLSLLRRARGYTPRALAVTSREQSGSVLAVGAHIKNTIALALPGEKDSSEVMLSAHLGDLEASQTRDAFSDNIGELSQLYRLKPRLAVHDLHPDYYSTRQAEAMAIPCLPVQHHWAHVAACIAEHNITGKVLGIAWDGVGLGDDSTAWGGEFLLADLHGYQRLGYLLPFPLPGGDQAARDIRRALLGALYRALDGDSERIRSRLPEALFTDQELDVWLSILDRGLNSTQTSSVGRLFDAVASLLGLCQHNRFEGEGAMQVQFAAETSPAQAAIELPLLTANNKTVIDWRPLILHLLDSVKQGASHQQLARLFHQTLIKALVDFSAIFPDHPVVLTGGCFQNRLLLELAVNDLRKRNIQVYWPQQVPANDGGIAFGQAAIGLNQNTSTEI